MQGDPGVDPRAVLDLVDDDRALDARVRRSLAKWLLERALPDVHADPLFRSHVGFPVHPGRILREELRARALSANALARALRVSSGRVVEILNGKRAISVETALRLARFFADSPQFWLGLQLQYDLATTERRLGRRIRAEVQAAA